MKNLTINSVTKVCKGTLYGAKEQDQNVEFTGVVIDSRKIEPGNLFIATKGERVDGHSFIPSSFEKGCYAVICEVLPENITGPCILVKDSFQALKDIAEFYRIGLSVKVVGITGSVGKTSTKEFIAGVLSEKYKVLKTQGNFNNEVGLPLTVLQITEEHEVAVLEMGISHFGEMHRLSKIARSDICVITNIGQCHLEFLGDRDGILRAKTEIFDYLPKGGKVCLNGDDDKLNSIHMVGESTPKRYGRNSGCDVYATDIQSRGLLGSTAKIHVKNEENNYYVIDATIPIPGEHMVDNAMAATLVGRMLGLSLEQITSGIANVASVSGRSNVIKTKHYVLIDDCYNANPVSMKAAIDLLATADTRKVAVLGDMFELGEEEDILHRQIGEYAEEKKIDIILCVGILAKNMFDGCKRSSNSVVKWFQTKQELMVTIQEIIKENDTILIKASHGMGFTEVVDLLKK